eukprot:TRINITY_DN18761_c0_g1_i1.p1 TRINITY_DN18761_c0_g1~~TRINITY_DN18761_c0_g1_i1.p1  ORF type:complete len:220 (-),score=53.71 TRINITY_DN18761_c0_g1_i1:144-803(-)
MQREAIKNRDSLVQAHKLRLLQRKQKNLEKLMQAKTQLSKRKLKKARVNIEPEEVEERDQIFNLTAIGNAQKIKRVSSNNLLHKPVNASKGDFASLSPNCIIEKINEAQKKNERPKFKGVGLESTVYYKKYMSERRVIDVKDRVTPLPEKYLKAFRTPHQANERTKSFNRIKQQLGKSSQKRSRSFVAVLESNLDRAFNLMNRDINRVTAYAKYNQDFL